MEKEVQTDVSAKKVYPSIRAVTVDRCECLALEVALLEGHWAL